MHSETGVDFNFNELKRLVIDGWKVVVAMVVLSLAAAFAYSRVQVLTYTAAARVSYKRTQSNKSAINQISNFGFSSESPSIDAYVAVLRSKSFAQKVGTLLLLTSDVDDLHFETPVKDLRLIDWMKWIGTQGLKRAPIHVLTGDDLLRGSSAALDIIQTILTFTPETAQTMLTVEATTTTPDSAAYLANKASEAIVKYTLSTELSSVIETKLFLEHEIKSVQERLEKANEALVSFKQINQKVAMPQAVLAVAAQASELDRKIVDLKSKLQANHTLFAYYEAKWDSQKHTLSNDLQSESSSPKVVEKLTEFVNELQLRRLQLLAQGISEAHDEVRSIDARIEKTRKVLDREAAIRYNKGPADLMDPLAENETIVKAMAALKDEAKRLEIEIASTIEAVATLSPKLKSIPQKELELASLEMKQRLNNEMYVSLSKRYEEIQIQEAGKKSEWEIIERASPPEASHSMSYIYRYLLSIACGFIVALSILGATQALRSPIRVLGSVYEGPERFLCNFPTLSGRAFKIKTNIGGATRDASKLLASEQLHADLVLNATYNAAFTLTEAAKGPQLIVVTSPNLREGKSVFAANLAIGLAQTGNKTLLIDGNFRSPEIQNLFKIGFTKGFAWALAEKRDPRDAIVGSRFRHLYILAVGAQKASMPLPTFEPLSRAINSLRKSYPVIIIDAGSIRQSSLAMLWASLASDIILVARRRITLNDNYHEGMQKLYSFKAARLWTCLNEVPARAQEGGVLPSFLRSPPPPAI